MGEKIKNALFSTAYLPPVEYFVFMLLSDNVLIEAHETYPKQTYRNRCYIYSCNGVESLHIPIIKPKGKHSKTNEVLISYKQHWQRNHWRAICTAYRNAPFFIYYQDFLEPFYKKQTEKLLDFNYALLNALLSEIGMDKSIGFTGNFEKNVTDSVDFRTTISPKSKNRSSSLTVTMPVYQQVFDQRYGFIPNLSIIDLLFNKGPDTLEYLMECSRKLDISSLKDMQS